MAVQFVNSESGEILEPKRNKLVIEGETVYVSQKRKTLSIMPVVWLFVLIVVFCAGGLLGQSFAHMDAENAGCDLDVHDKNMVLVPEDQVK